MLHSDSFQVTEDGATLRIEWDNRRMRKSWFLLVFLILFWLFWAPATVYATCALAAAWVQGQGDLAGVLLGTIWCPIAWLGVVIIPWSLLSWRWRERVEISPTSIEYEVTGWLAPRFSTIPITPRTAIVLGYWGVKMFNGLWILGPCFGLRSRKAIIASWLLWKKKEEIFRLVKAHVEAHDIPLSVEAFGSYHLPKKPSTPVATGSHTR